MGSGDSHRQTSDQPYSSIQRSFRGHEAGTRETEVIWPTWPATIEEEAEAATSPLADLQRYWAVSGNRLRESAKWMAAVLGAALAAVVGTSPSADISSHHLRLSAALIGLAGLMSLAVTMLFVLRVMQSPEVSFEQIKAAAGKADGIRRYSQEKRLSDGGGRLNHIAICTYHAR